MKKRFLKGFIIVLLCVLLLEVTATILMIKNSRGIAKTPYNNSIENENPESIDTSSTDDKNVLVAENVVIETEHETVQENKPIEPTNDNVVSNNVESKTNKTTTTQPNANTQKNSNSSSSNKKADTSSSTQAVTTQTTTKQPEAVQPTTQPTTTVQSTKTQPTEPQTKEETLKCTGNNHFMNVGNSKKWFNTEKEAISYYDSIIKNWSNKWENFEIDDETYKKNCPYGYQDWSCICGKWTIDFYYR